MFETLALIVLSLFVFLGAAPGPIRIHDDQASILACEELYRRGFKRWIWDCRRPCYEFLNTLNYKLCGFWAPGWHLVNIGLHVLSVLVLYSLLQRLGCLYAFWLACAFAVHPIQTASVCYISGRSGILAGLFLFLGAWLYLGPLPWPFLSAVPFGLAYLSREDSLVALTWLPVLEWFRFWPYGP